MTARVAVLSEPTWMPDFIPDGVIPPCRDVDPELFFPDTGNSYDEARAVCAGCPVQQPCADWAIDAGVRHGMWGALNPDELAARRRMRRLWT